MDRRGCRKVKTATPLPKHRPTGHAKQITAQQEPGQPGSRSSTPGRRRADRRSAARRWPPQQSRCSDLKPAERSVLLSAACTSPPNNSFSTPPPETGVQGCAPPPAKQPCPDPDSAPPPCIFFFGAAKAARPSGGHFQRTREHAHFMHFFFVFFAWAPLGGAQTLTTTTALSGWALTREGTSTTPREGKRGGGGCYREGDYRGGTTGMGTTGEGD